MGKLIPPPYIPSETAPAEQVPRSLAPGPCQLQARELIERLRVVEENLDLDELDRLARRYARPPASGAPDALEALAVVVRAAPHLFHRTEVNLDPVRLEQIADRQRALGLLASSLGRFQELVQDSQLEQGDEIVELLTVGWSRIQGLREAQGDGCLAAAVRVLASYQERVVAEGAHRIPAGQEGKKTPRAR